MITSRTLTADLGGRWHGAYGRAACPVCQPERRPDQTALTLSVGADGRLLLHCKKAGCTFTDILCAAGVTPGSYNAPDPGEQARRAAERHAEAVKKAQQARAIWNKAKPITGTPAEAYLRNRGITAALPETLRFHPECWYGPTATRHPAMIARIDEAKGFAIHRTYIRSDGSGKAALEPQKMMLGATGGGAVRLSNGSGPLVVCEGIETGLALASGLIRYPDAAIIATLSTSGMTALRLPASPGRLTIATDGDVAGAEAGRKLAERAHATGWAVSMLPAPRGRDWNDILVGKVVTL